MCLAFFAYNVIACSMEGSLPVPHPDKPESEAKPKGVSRKARKGRKENLTSWFLKKLKTWPFLAGLASFAR